MSYLAENNTFYSSIMLQNRLYSTTHPNSEEAARASVILKYLSVIRQHYIDPGLTPRLLDLGCGRGWLTMLISAFGRAEGIEPAEGMIKLAKEYYPQLVFRCETLGDLLKSSGAASYDVIITSEVIEHIPQAEKKDFLKQIHLALKPNGHCILTTPRRELFKLFTRKHKAGQLIEEWSTEKQLRSLFNQCRFEVIEHDRAFPMRPTLFCHPDPSINLTRWLTRLKLEFLMRAVDHILSIYQVWWLRKPVEPVISEREDRERRVGNGISNQSIG
jgi:2-polyprenyl-3-methyl-5-hydroxy-6-metoxy-1,4-benzoquinol methylase